MESTCTEQTRLETKEVGATYTGWHTIAKTVSEVDERKIQDCKDDIDTLLVLAGLFSAVMTAFIIESYKTLQEDPADTTVQLLRQIAEVKTTNSSIAGSADPQVPAFEPSASAIKVNVLWFASLVCSLMTASLGMLVKQWLREYLAGGYTSPQERLRIRHLRYPGLINWHVFEIAAMLPLLLQLSLGLFFTGLCFFTWSVHASIGRTCVPLIAGWALFIVSTALAPAFSTSCPYKTAILRGFMRFTRPWVYRGIAEIRESLFLAARGIVERFPQSLRGFLGISLPMVFHSSQYDIGPREEESVAERSEEDVDILITVDRILSDDELLRSTVYETLLSTRPRGDDVLAFVLAIISHRLQYDVTVQSLPVYVPRLSPQAHSTIISAISHLLRWEKFEHNPWYEGLIQTWTPWRGEAVVLLIYFSDDTLNSDVIAVLEPHLANPSRRSAICSILASVICMNDTADFRRFNWYIRQLCRISTKLDDMGVGFTFMEELVGRCVLRDTYEPDNFRLTNLMQYPRTAVTQGGSLWTLHAVLVHLVHLTLNQRIERRDDSPWAPSWVTSALTTILHIACKVGTLKQDSGNGYLAFIFRECFTNRWMINSLLAWLSRDGPDFLEVNWIRVTMHSLYKVHEDITGCLVNFIDSIHKDNHTDAIALSYIAIVLVDSPDAYGYRKMWRELFSALTPAVDRLNTGEISKDRVHLAGYCLWYIHTIDCHPSKLRDESLDPSVHLKGPMLDPDNEVTYNLWRHQFDPAASLFPDEYVEALSKVWGRGERWYRTRLIRESAGSLEQRGG